MRDGYDYIVVGAGTAGCALADKLSRDPANQVLLLEAGGHDRNPMIHIPLGFAFLVKNKKVSWGYQTEPEPELENRRIDWPRGKVLGGCSSINGMVHIRGHAQDYDHWADLGNRGWSYEELLPYFKSHEHNARGVNAYRGQGGPLWVEDVAYQFPMSDLFVQAAQDEGLPFNEDFCGPAQDGVGYFQVNIKNGRRQSSAVAYRKGSRERTNLDLQTGALTTEIILEGGRAVGVRVLQKGKVQTVRCAGEVILCGGSINSPQLLELSGIGNPQHLEKCEIPVKHALPGVGENLQDHLTVHVCQGLQGIQTFYEEMKPLTFFKNLLKYFTKRSGMFCFPSAQVGAFFKTTPDVDRADAQIHFAPAAGEYNDKGVMVVVPGTTASVCYLRPKSRGSVHVRTRDPKEHPAICANYLSAAEDRLHLIEGVKKTRAIFAQKVLDPYRSDELLPGPNIQTDEEILDYIRREGVSVYHPVGTCKMGNDESAVVDDQLRVRGLSGLRVADGSIMPTLLSANTNATCIVIADKCADMILAKRQD